MNRYATALIFFFLLGQSCLGVPEFDFQVPEVVEKKKPVGDLIVDLDLSSGRECVPASMAFEAEGSKASIVTVNEGDTVRSVSRNCMLTAGEYFAVRQAIGNQEQRVDLNGHGTAVAGTVEVDAFTAQHCRNLYLPANLTLTHDAVAVPKFKLPGELFVGGKYLLVGKAKNCTISARLVNVACNGFIGTAGFKGQEPIALVLEATGGVHFDVANQQTHFSQDVIYGGQKNKNKRGAGTSEETVESDYELHKVHRTLIHTQDQYIPTDGQNDNVIEGSLQRQERESCERKANP